MYRKKRGTRHAASGTQSPEKVALLSLTGKFFRAKKLFSLK
jgi:hypothetical protein